MNEIPLTFNSVNEELSSPFSVTRFFRLLSVLRSVEWISSLVASLLSSGEWSWSLTLWKRAVAFILGASEVLFATSVLNFPKSEISIYHELSLN